MKEATAHSGVEEASSAYARMTTAATSATTAIGTIQSDVQTLQTAVGPVVNDVMAATRLKSVLMSLDGPMKIANFVAEVQYAYVIQSLNENSTTNIAPPKGSPVGQIGVGGRFCSVQSAWQRASY
jgi:hypothetical protein